MIRLRIDSRCVDCGNCETHLPGLMKHKKTNGVLISPTNENVDAEAIQLAIDSCPLEFLLLESL